MQASSRTFLFLANNNQKSNVVFPTMTHSNQYILQGTYFTVINTYCYLSLTSFIFACVCNRPMLGNPGGLWIPDSTLWIPHPTTWISDSTSPIPDSTPWIPDSTSGNPDSTLGIWIPLLGFSIPLPGFRIPLLGFRIPLLGIQTPLLGFWIPKLKRSDYFLHSIIL